MTPSRFCVFFAIFKTPAGLLRWFELRFLCSRYEKHYKTKQIRQSTETTARSEIIDLDHKSSVYHFKPFALCFVGWYLYLIETNRNKRNENIRQHTRCTDQDHPFCCCSLGLSVLPVAWLVLCWAGLAKQRSFVDR